MFKYDDVISTLTLVNTLARDPNYGNIKQVNCNCDKNFQNIYLKTEQGCNFVVFKNSDFYKNIFAVAKKFLRFKLLVRNLQKYFYRYVNVCENLIIFLQKMVLYNLCLKCGYG